MSISKRLRYEIFRRDDYTCRYCGATAPDAPLRIDHVTPVALGGSDKPSNLVTACEPCNSGKTSTTPGAPLVANVADDALRWSQAMRQASELLATDQKNRDEYRGTFQAAWNSSAPLPASWKQSIETFRLAGLPASVWPDNVEKAMSRAQVPADAKFRYVCGIAWKQMNALQDSARALLTEQPPLVAVTPSRNGVVESLEDHEPDECLVEYLAMEWSDAWRRSSWSKSPPTNEQEVEFRKSAFGLIRSDITRKDYLFTAAVMAGRSSGTDIVSWYEGREANDPELVAVNAVTLWRTHWRRSGNDEAAMPKQEPILRQQVNAAVIAGYDAEVVVLAAGEAGEYGAVELAEYLFTIEDALALGSGDAPPF